MVLRVRDVNNRTLLSFTTINLEKIERSRSQWSIYSKGKENLFRRIGHRLILAWGEPTGALDQGIMLPEKSFWCNYTLATVWVSLHTLYRNRLHRDYNYSHTKKKNLNKAVNEKYWVTVLLSFQWLQTRCKNDLCLINQHIIRTNNFRIHPEIFDKIKFLCD